MSAVLPEGFAALEPFVALWVREDLAARARRRDESTGEERAEFHEAFAPRAEAVFARLAGKRLDALDPAERNLMDLALAYAHVALAVEIQGPAEEHHAALRAQTHLSSFGLA